MINDIKAIPDYATLTSQQIADYLRATGLTHRSINRADLVHNLNMVGMLRKIVSNNDNEKWTGTVLNMQDAIMLGGTQEQQDGIRLWFSHITNVSNTIWDTTQVSFAAPYWQMVQIFAGMAGMPTLEDFTAIAALGGGWRFAELTAEQVDAALAADALAASKRALEDAATDRLQVFREALAAWDGVTAEPVL